MLGHEFSQCTDFSFFERWYIRIWGIPILGLRIRAWHMLPLIKTYAAAAKRVLDMGSGRGVFTIEIAKHLPHTEVVGVDKDYAHKIRMANELAKKIGLSNCSFEQVDIFAKDFKQRFDAILSIDVLEHIRDDAESLKKLFGLLNEGGTLILHVPHYYRNTFGKKRLNFPDIEGHERIGYLLEDLETLFRHAGLIILTKGYTYSSFETLANDMSYGITRGREKNKWVYSLIFPLLLGLAFLGKHVTPRYGSGIYMIAKREHTS